MRLRDAAVLVRMGWLLAKGRPGEEIVADLRDWPGPNLKQAAGMWAGVLLAIMVVSGLFTIVARVLDEGSAGEQETAKSSDPLAVTR